MSLKKQNANIIWCPGCALYAVFDAVAKTMEELGWNEKNTVVVSGIGCTARGAGYFALDSVNALHGRAIPIAEGIKTANPDLNVVVFSGDGDLLSIGGNHLLHASRRNAGIKVICVSNEVYGMTGGQTSPATPRGAKTITSPAGSIYEPINAQGLISSNKSYFFGRGSATDIVYLKQIIKESFLWNGFSFVEARAICVGGNYLKQNNINSPKDAFDMLSSNFKKQEKENELKENELGIVSKQ